MTSAGPSTPPTGQRFFRSVSTVGIWLLIVVVVAGITLGVVSLVIRPFSVWTLALLIVGVVYVALALREIRRRRDHAQNNSS